MKELTRQIKESDPRLLSGDTITPTIVVDASNDSMRFMERVAVEIPFKRYYGKAKIQRFERVRALALSDFFEDVTEQAKAQLTTPYEPGELRESELYTVLYSDIEDVARRLSGPETPEEFVARVGPRIREQLAKVAISGGEKERGKAAAELFERELPKMPRSAGGPTQVVVLSEGSAKMLQDALRERAKGET